MERNYWLDGIMGVVTGDALGCPVQFLSRSRIAQRPQGPVTGMEEYGTYNMPVGTWTDDGSMTLATLSSLIEKGGVDPEDIMTQFVRWEFEGEYTPFGEAFDEGNTCSSAIFSFKRNGDISTCGCRSESSNGNGSLMRILPACLYYCYKQKGSGITDEEAIERIHTISSLTHGHLRSLIACGMYYFMVKNIVEGIGADGRHQLTALLQAGIDEGMKFYGKDPDSREELAYFERLSDLSEFGNTPAEGIRSSGYVIDTLEAAVWCLITTDSFEECLLKAVNLGDDTDTVGAIAGGLAGLYYGYESIPAEWLSVIRSREWIEELCDKGNNAFRLE